MRSKVFLVLLISCLLYAASSWPADASQQPASSSEVLGLVPEDAIFYLHAEGKALWNSPVMDELKKKLSAEKWKAFEKSFFEMSEKASGIPRQQVRSVSIILDSWAVPSVPGFAILIQSDAALERVKFIKNLRSFFAEKFGKPVDDPETFKVDGVEAHQVTQLPGKNIFGCLITEKLAAVGDDETLKKLVKRHSTAKAGPDSAFVKAAQGHDVALGLQISESLHDQLMALMEMSLTQANRMNSQNEFNNRLGMEVIKCLLDIKRLGIHLDVQRKFELGIQVDANSDIAAVRFQRLLDMWALVGDVGLHYAQGLSTSTSARELREFTKFLGMLATAMAQSKVTRQGTKVDMKVSIPEGGPAFNLAATAFLYRATFAWDKMIRASNLRQLAIAMHNYHNDYDKLPSPGYYKGFRAIPAANSNEKPLFSWRVAVLPYIEYDHLYKQFNFNEPWDSEHNKKLIPKMPKVFQCPGAPDPGEGKTYLQVFVAPEKPADPNKQKFAPIFRWGGQGLTLGQLTVQDGTSNTLMIAESAKPVIWTKPEDLLIEGDDQPLPKLGCMADEDDFQTAFGDASVRAIRRSLNDAKLHERLLRQLIGRRDGMNEDVSPIVK